MCFIASKEEILFYKWKEKIKLCIMKDIDLGTVRTKQYITQEKILLLLGPLYLYNLLYSWLVQSYFSSISYFFLLKYQPNFLKTFVSSFHYLSYNNNTAISTTIGIPLIWIFRTLKNEFHVKQVTSHSQTVLDTKEKTTRSQLRQSFPKKIIKT